MTIPTLHPKRKDSPIMKVDYPSNPLLSNSYQPLSEISESDSDSMEIEEPQEKSTKKPKERLTKRCNSKASSTTASFVTASGISNVHVTTTKAAKEIRKDISNAIDNHHRRVLTTNLITKLSGPTQQEIQVIAELVAAATVFDSYDIDNFRQMRELIRRKAAERQLHFRVKDIAEVIKLVIDEHMIMVALTEQWKNDEALKMRILHINNLSHGVFKVDDLSLMSKLKAYVQSLTKTICFWEAPNLPNKLPGSNEVF
jgi:hypothetical protein